MTAEPIQDGGDPYDVRLAHRATGLLGVFNQAGVLSAADVHVARRLHRLGAEDDERVLLAAALAVRAVREGSVCVELAETPHTVAAGEESRVGIEQLPWPEAGEWLAACAASPLVATGVPDEPPGGPGRPLRLVDGLLYLDRYWREEELVRVELDARAAAPVATVDVEQLRRVLATLFPGQAPDRRRLAAAMTALRSVTVLSGGPGTGKTTTVARLLAMLRALPGGPPRVALAAPTGKAAARLQEAIDKSAADFGLDVGDSTAMTLHRLLGWRPDSRTRFRHHRHNRLPYDAVVVDETSMVSLTQMSRLLEAVRPQARLVLVGDPDQLASIEAGAVLGDLVARPSAAGGSVPAALGDLAGDDLEAGEQSTDSLRNGVVSLTHTYRFGHAIDALARAIRCDEPDEVLRLLRARGPHISFLETAAVADRSTGALVEVRTDVVAAATELTAAARAGDAVAALAALGRHRLLCAHRRGPYGVARWTVEIERWLAAEIDRYAAEGEWYRGRPLMVTANDYDLGVYNGDTGVVIDDGHGRPEAVFGQPRTPQAFSPSRLAAVATVHAMTVHKAQGSQFERVSLLLPPQESPLLTRELFYTAVTRAESHVRVVGTEAAVRRAVERPIVRASGLRRPR